jgi:hypothetical protein
VADATVRGTRIHADENEEHFLWGGFRLELYRDATASYWANLTGTSPSLFVLCDEQESGELLPKMVTADQEEASAGVEVNEKVFSVPIPPEVYQHIEAVVVAHHVPEEKKRRKRTNWSESQGS